MNEIHFENAVLRRNGKKCYPPPFFTSYTGSETGFDTFIYARKPEGEPKYAGNHIVGAVRNLSTLPPDQRMMTVHNYCMLLEQQWHSLPDTKGEEA